MVNAFPAWVGRRRLLGVGETRKGAVDKRQFEGGWVGCKLGAQRVDWILVCYIE